MELLVGVAPPHRITSAGLSLESCEQRVGVDRAPGGDRTHVPRFAGACLATWLPVRSSGARTRTSIAGAKGQRPAIGRHPSIFVEPSLGVEPSPLAYQASVPRRGHRDGDAEDRGEDRNRTGRSRIASAARPLGTCLPVRGPDEDRTRLSRSTAAHPHQRITEPEDHRNKAGVCEGNRTLPARFTDSRANHYTTHTIWIESSRMVSREGVEPSTKRLRVSCSTN